MPDIESTSTDPAPSERRSTLERDLRALRERYRTRTRKSRAFIIMGLACFAGSPLAYFASGSTMLFLVLIFYGCIFLSFPLLRPASEIEVQIRDVENEIDLLRIADTSIEQRAEKLFKLHQFELKKYYDQTLRHSSWIFLVGIGCIVGGFAVIGVTLYLVQSGVEGTQLSEKIVIAALGAIGGILANFIAVIYLKMHSETLKSLTEFHNRLVVTHHLHFGNFLAAKIADIPQREKVISAMAESLAKTNTAN